jgi:hypothetical protein
MLFPSPIAGSDAFIHVYMQCCLSMDASVIEIPQITLIWQK